MAAKQTPLTHGNAYKYMVKFLILISALALFPASGDLIEITQKESGKSIKVALIESTNTHVSFKLKGKLFNVELTSLTDESVEKIKAVATAEQDKYKKVNDAVGQPLFGDGDLWGEKAGGIAKRLAWKRESIKATNSSYREYPGANYRFLGARPFSIALYGGAEDTPERISIVFANKGDSANLNGLSGEDHFKNDVLDLESVLKEVNKAIKADEETISNTLSATLGEPKEQFYGERADRRRVQRWDIGTQSFLLSAERDEYVHLLIVPVEDADKEGKIKFVKDSIMKERQLKNLRHEENGDVWIDNIPMVNQGPKGYCAPASFERAMRYMNVPADMYLLATSATSPGGGTNTLQLSEDVRGILMSKARRIRDLNLRDKLSIKDVRSYINKGVPVLWQMRSLDIYNQIANVRTAERAKVTDFSAWAKMIEEEAEEVAPLLNAQENHHICLIIGYNEETNELAVSDSWGPNYELRWIHADIAAAITSQHTSGFVIDF